MLKSTYNQFNDMEHKSSVHLSYDKKYNLPALITGNQRFYVSVGRRRENVYVSTLSEIGHCHLESSGEDYLENNEVVNISRRAKRMNAQDRYDRFKREWR